jgi:hypothetical protein
LNPVRLLLNSVIDYAGLFPPANLGMAEAVANYSDYRAGEFSWALGRFIVPVSRLTEFESCLEELRLPLQHANGWHLSVLGSPDVKSDLRRIDDFNLRHSAQTAVMIDSIELRPDSAEAIDRLLNVMPGRFQTYLEIPVAGDTREMIAAVAERGGRAKVRTGGVAPEAFPAPAQLAGFIQLCVEAGIRFKATAGLHHPLRSIHPLTYEPSGPVGMMHGFLNLLIASALAYAGADVEATEAILQEETIEAFAFDGAGIHWRDLHVGRRLLRNMRERLFVSFGACSFQEPTSETNALNLL